MKQQVLEKRIMTKGVQIFGLLLIFLLAFSFSAEAQKKKPSTKNKEKDKDVKDYFDESGVGAHRFWYGGGFILGFDGGNGYSQFDIGLSPMLGYKITPEFSIGPRVEITYSHVRSSFSGFVDKYNLLSYGAGLFTRYKIFNQFFIHAEYQIESRGYANVGSGDTFRESKNNFYGGVGYTSGGLVGYEIALLWNFLEETADLPIDYRIAFTYNF